MISHLAQRAPGSQQPTAWSCDNRVPTLYSRLRTVKKIGICGQPLLQKCFPVPVGSSSVNWWQKTLTNVPRWTVVLVSFPSCDTFFASFSSVPSSVGVGPNRGKWFVLGRMQTPSKCWTLMNVPSWRDPPASNLATSSLVGPNGLTPNGAW